MRTTSMAIIVASFLFFGGCVTLPKPDVLLVCFGDSATAGAEEPTYPQLLADLAGVERKTIDNAGKSGETSTEGLERLQDLLEQEVYPNATGLIFWEGGNDIIDFIQATDPFLLTSPLDEDYPFRDQLATLLLGVSSNLSQAIQLGKDRGWNVSIATYYNFLETPEVATLACKASPLGFITPAQSMIANQYTFMLNEAIEIVADGYGIPLSDMRLDNPVLQNISCWHDCNHLNGNGNEILAQRFFSVISSP